VSGNAAFRQEVMTALAERLAPKAPSMPPSTSPSTPLSTKGVIVAAARRSLGRSWAARFIDRRVSRHVEHAIAQLRGEASELRDEQTEVLDALAVNAEMLKAQVRAVNRNLEHLAAGVTAMAMAIAPTAGIEGVPDRFAELRERLNAVERRTRGLSGSGVTTEQHPGGAPATAAGTAAPTSPIDYVGFERRFRGDASEVQEITRERYLELLRDHGPVLDVGCGKGELVEALIGAGVRATGIDLDAAMVDEARARGLDVHVADLNDFLATQPAQSFGSIISTQVAEHLQMADLVRFLELSASRLRPGGLFVAETPNPTSLIVLGTHFLLDPTHVRPIHPGLMVYLCECAGFRSVDLRFYAPAAQYHLTLLEESSRTPWAAEINANFTRINDVLFGPQDYAVVAQMPGDGSSGLDDTGDAGG
jgi:2-polyprenyl-3-methyl-5-hydroxy-6-metoxy-1,4-benzoquinol methylase